MTLDPRFNTSIISAAQASHAKFFPRGPFTSIILAQWADESAYGKQQSGLNNFFGIKATALQISQNQATRRTTKEFIGGVYHIENLYFANYNTLQDGFDAHGYLLTQPWYSHCMAAQTPQDYAMALHTDHYATEPSYAQILVSIMNANDLYQFDKAA